MEHGRIIHSDFPWYWYSDGTIMDVGNDTLELGIRRNPREVKHWDGKTYHPTIEAATMRSREDFSFGTFSAEIMLPDGKGLWPSFWLTGSGNWPPEIDIMEAWSGNGCYFKLFIAQPPYFRLSWRTTTNVHYLDETMEHDSVGSRNIPYMKQRKNPEDNFVRYECEWLPDSITFRADGKDVRKVTGDVCRKLTENIKDPEKGFRMNAMFNVWCENPETHNVTMRTPMAIRDFRYVPFE